MKKDEDVVEVEEVEPVDDDEARSIRRSRRSRRGDDDEDKPSRWKTILAVIVVIVILLSIFLAYFFLVEDVKEIHLETPQPNEDGISVFAHVVMDGGSTASGDGEVDIFYGNTNVYSGTITFNRDEGLKIIKYDEFVVGNLEYTVKVTFRDKSKSETFKLDRSPFFWTVAEYLEVEPTCNPPSLLDIYNAPTSPKLNIPVSIIDKDGNNPNAPAAKSKITLKVQYEGGSEQTYSKEIIEGYEAMFDSYNYLSTGSGNYTFTATWENLYVKSDSEFREIELSEPLTQYFNMPIIAMAGDDETLTIGRLDPDEKTIEFDGRDSLNDGVITLYQWDFDYKDDDDDNEWDFTVDAEGPVVSNTYTNNDFGLYTVALKVYGEGIFGYYTEDPDYEVGFDTLDVIVKMGIS